MKLQLFELDEKQLRTFRKIAVVGDLHGDYDALKSALSIVDPAKDGIIFLGDYADRGPSGIEVIDAVDSLARNNTRNVFALKGNHEDYTESGEPEFWPCTLTNEANEKGGDWQNYFARKFKPFVERLHLAIIAPGETLFVHGGVSSKIRSLNDLKHPTRDIERDILWSDPFEGHGERVSERGAGLVEFGADVTTKVCKLLGVKRIVRSHEPLKALKGPLYSHNHRVITISSTSVYGGEPCFLNIDPSDFSRTRSINLTRSIPTR